jgi:hypothetical protein
MLLSAWPAAAAHDTSFGDTQAAVVVSFDLADALFLADSYYLVRNLFFLHRE